MIRPPHKPRPGEINGQIAIRLGRRLAPQMEPVCTFEQIAAAFGVSNARAQQLCHMALGKFAWKLKKRFPDYVL